MIRVLIAADDKNPKKILVNALSESGYDVSGTDSGMKAVELSAEDEYDILPPDLDASRKAAELPGISPKTLYNKLLSYGVTDEA